MKNATPKNSHDCRDQRPDRSVLRTFIHNESGQAFVELALVMPIFVLLLLGAAEFARLEYASIEVSNAARAGVQYGAQNRTTAMDLCGMAQISCMAQAAINDGSNITSLQATASNFCVCSDGTSITCADAAADCIPPARIVEYVQVNTSAVVNPLIHYPGLPEPFTLQGQATMRVEQ